MFVHLRNEKICESFQEIQEKVCGIAGGSEMNGGMW